MLKILGLDAVHPDEMPAGEPCDAWVKTWHQQPIDGLQVIIGNEDAYALEIENDGLRHRKVTENLVYAEADAAGTSEQRRIHQLLYSVFPGYDLIVDRHGTRMPGGDYAFCSPEADQVVWDALAFLGLRRVVHYGPDHIASRVSNYLGLDLGPDSEFTVARLHPLVKQYIAGGRVQQHPVSRYRFVGDVSIAQARKCDLPPTMVAFEPLGTATTQALGLPFGSVLLAGGYDLYGHTGYYGEAAVPIQ